MRLDLWHTQVKIRARRTRFWLRP